MKEYDEAWKARFPHRPLPHVWSDEALVITEVHQRRIDAMFKDAHAEIMKLRKRVHKLEHPCNETPPRRR